MRTQHGYLVKTDGLQSRAVRAMVPRGRHTNFDHVLVLEKRGFLDWASDLWDATCDLVETIVTVIVDIVVEVVTKIIDTVVSAIKGVAKVLNDAMDAVNGFLMGIAARILKGLIGCSPIEAANTLQSQVTGSLAQKLKDWVEGWLFDKLNQNSLERDAADDAMAAFEKRLHHWNHKRHTCVRAYKTKVQRNDPLWQAIQQQYTECFEAVPAPLDEDEQLAMQGVCDSNRNSALQEYKMAFFSGLSDKDIPCDGLGDRPVMTDEERRAAIADSDASLERGGHATASPKRRLIHVEKEKSNKETELEREITMESMFSSDIRAAMQAFGRTVSEECTSLFPPTPNSLERVARDMEVIPSQERGWFTEIFHGCSSTGCPHHAVAAQNKGPKNCGGACSCDLEDQLNGCTSCKCKPAICLSVALEISAGASWASGSGGGELGFCITFSMSNSNKPPKTTAFVALGAGLSLGVGLDSGPALSGSLAITVLRDIGDVAGHALMAGFSIGKINMAAVWAVGANAETAAEIIAEGGDPTSFLHQMMSTTFVGLTFGIELGSNCSACHLKGSISTYRPP